MTYGRHVYHLYVLRTPRRDELVRKLNDDGIGTSTHYAVPLHLQPASRYLNYKAGDFPVAEICAREVLSLPIYPELTEEQIELVAKMVKKCL
jgi:dTDP-4-amino-4,6-dideoxygalactose transaminase